MSKKDNKLNPYEVTGQFRILLKSGRLFAGEIKGAWDDAFLVSDPLNGDSIIFIDSISVMMEGLEPPGDKRDDAEKDINGGAPTERD